MRSPHGNRARLGGVLLAAAAAIAILVLPGLAAGHGRHHHDHGDAGTIRSFDLETGVLTIDLAKGGSVSGLVVRRTHIRCGNRKGHRQGRRHLRRHKRGQRAAVSSRRGGDRGEVAVEDQSGDDRGGPRDGQSEDPRGHDGTPPGSSEGPGQGEEHSARCNAGDLVPGAPVKVAELVLTNGNAYYRLVGLAKQAPADEQPEEGEDEGEEAPAEG